MRLIVGWSLKLSLAALVYVGFQGGLDLKFPETVLGYKVPDSMRHSLEAPAQLKDLAAQTQGGFKKISESMGR